MSKAKEYWNLIKDLEHIDPKYAKHLSHKTIEDAKKVIEENLIEAKKNKGGGFRQFAPTEAEMIRDAEIEMKIAVCESLKYEI